jgi:ABC-type methionine transport system ATPase subunit
LSGGQAQCAAIARALVNDPSVIIADEPTGNLDSANSRLVMELLSDIHKTGGTILFVTHNPELTRYATRVVYMHDGAVIHDEQTVIGEVAATARRIMFTVPTKTEEDDLAGVSTLMKHVPDATLAVDASPAKTPVKKKAKSRTKAKKSRSAKK